jgi:hypothetical protein
MAEYALTSLVKESLAGEGWALEAILKEVSEQTHVYSP